MRNKIEERIKNKTYNKRKVLVVFLCAAFVLFCLIGRLVYLMIFDAEYYQNWRRNCMKGRGRSKRPEGRS